MSGQPAVVVNKKGGFLTALVQGVFGAVIVIVICATIVSLYGMWMFDKGTDRALVFGRDLSENIDSWRQLMPPVLEDALSDRAALDYRTQMTLGADVVGAAGDQQIVLTVANNGIESVSHMSANVVVGDVTGRIIGERVVQIATPWAMDDHGRQAWRGPLLQGSVRRFPVEFCPPIAIDAGVTVSIELTDLRVTMPKTALDNPDRQLPMDDGDLSGSAG